MVFLSFMNQIAQPVPLLQSIIRWIFETKELQNKYDGSLTLNKIDCLSMGRYTCQAVNMLGGDNRYVDVTVTCEYYILVHFRLLLCR
jgi:outer membrane protein assembly factor BamA